MKIDPSIKYYSCLALAVFTLNSCTTKTSYKTQENDAVDETKKENVYRLNNPTPKYKQSTPTTQKNKTDDEFQPTYHRDNIFAPKEEKRTSPDFKQLERK